MFIPRKSKLVCNVLVKAIVHFLWSQGKKKRKRKKDPDPLLNIIH